MTIRILLRPASELASVLMVASLSGCASRSALPTSPPHVSSTPAARPQPSPLEVAALGMPDGEPVLRMPFPSGTVVLCQQGNISGPFHSHSYANALHALDLSTPNHPDTEVLAAASGKVIRVVTGGAPGASMPGWGLGNQVVIDHGHGYFTMYGHLKDTRVHLGEAVKSGAVIGVVGETGQAGNPHLHFTLHNVPLGEIGAPPTTIMHGLLTEDMREPAGFALHDSLEMKCGDSDISPKAHLYASENDEARAPLVGVAPGELATTLAARADELTRFVATFVAPKDLVAALLDREKSIGPQLTRDKLDAVDKNGPDGARAVYWSAVVSLRDLDDWEGGKKRLQALETLTIRDNWMPGWILVWRARVAEHEGKKTEAKRLWIEVKKIPDANDDLKRLSAEASAKYGL